MARKTARSKKNADKSVGSLANLFNSKLVLASEGKDISRPSKLSNLVQMIRKYENFTAENFNNDYLDQKQSFSMALRAASCRKSVPAKVDPSNDRVAIENGKWVLNDGETDYGMDPPIERELLPASVVYKSCFNQKNGQFVYVPSHFYFNVMMLNSDFIKCYFENLNVSWNGDNRIPADLEEARRKMQYLPENTGTQTFDTSYTMVPTNDLKHCKITRDYNMIRQRNALNKIHNEVKLEVYGNVICPVIGYFLTTEDLMQIRSTYVGHPFYAMYMTHILWVLSNLAEPTKSVCKNPLKIDSNSILPPCITVKKKATIFSVYTANAQVTTIQNVFHAKLDLQMDSNSTLWQNVDPLMYAVQIALEESSSLHTLNQRVQGLELEIKVTTHAIKALKNSTDWSEKLEDKKKGKIIVSQQTVVMGRYVGDSPLLFQPNVQTVFVTTNRGYNHKTSPKIVAMFIGEGMPLQMELDQMKYPMFGHNIPTYPTELTTMALVKSAYNILKHETVTGFDRFNNVVPVETQKQSALRNFIHINTKTQDTTEVLQYHHASMCSQHMSFLVIGMPSISPYGFQRVKAVYWVLPQGTKSGLSFCPEWDQISISNLKNAIHAAAGNQGLKKALEDYVDKTKTNLQDGRSDSPPLDEGEETMAEGDVSRAASGGAEGATRAAGVGEDGTMTSRKLDTSLFYNVKLTLDEVLAAASQPSIFDEEVYM